MDKWHRWDQYCLYSPQGAPLDDVTIATQLVRGSYLVNLYPPFWNGRKVTKIALVTCIFVITLLCVCHSRTRAFKILIQTTTISKWLSNTGTEGFCNDVTPYSNRRFYAPSGCLGSKRNLVKISSFLLRTNTLHCKTWASRVACAKGKWIMLKDVTVPGYD